MDWSRKLAIMFRWSLLGVIVIGLFWSAWYLLFGEPHWINVRIGMTGSMEFVMWPVVPGLKSIIGYERFADILIAPAWAVLITLTLSTKKTPLEKKGAVAFWGLLLGAVSAWATLNHSLLFGFSLGAIVAITLMLFGAIEQGSWYGIFVGLAIHLFTGLIIALAFGIFAGLLFLVYMGLPLLFFALLILAAVNFQKITGKITSWLLAR